MQALHFHSFSRSLSFITHSAAAAPLEHLLVQLRPPVHKVAAPHLPPPPGWRGLNRGGRAGGDGSRIRLLAQPATSRAGYKPGRLQAGPTRQLQPGTGPFALAPVVSRRRADGGRRRVADKQGGQQAGPRTGHPLAGPRIGKPAHALLAGLLAGLCPAGRFGCRFSRTSRLLMYGCSLFQVLLVPVSFPGPGRPVACSPGRGGARDLGQGECGVEGAGGVEQVVARGEVEPVVPPPHAQQPLPRPTHPAPTAPARHPRGPRIAYG